MPGQHTELRYDDTVRSVVLMGRYPYLGFLGGYGPDDHRAAEAAMEAVGLGSLADRRLHELSGGEFQLLRVLVEPPGRVLTRDQLLDLARGPSSEAFDRAIDVQISRLRRKLEDGAGRDPIRSVRGEGYMFAGVVRKR